nr:hypothetical protein [Tanacetum cinerariifolium]
MSFELNYSDEAKEFKRIYDELAVEYANRLRYHQYLSALNEKISAQNKRMRIQRKNLLLKNDELIAVDLTKEVGLIVLASDKTVSPTSNCQCEELESTCNKEYSRVLNLEAEVLEKQQMLTKSEQQIFIIQKQFVDLQVKFQNYKEGPTDSSLDTKALETENAQLKKSLTSFKVTYATLDRCYQELSKANNHLHSTSLEKIASQREEIATLKAEAVGKKMNGPTGTPKPKVLASMMYTKRSKYIVPPRRADWVPSTPLPKKKQSVKTKPHQAKRVVNTSGNARKNTKEEVARIVPIWKPTGRRFNLCDFYGTQKSTEHIVKPSELTPCVSPSTNATLSMKLTLDPLELSSSVSSSPSSTITMVSRFSDHSLSDRKASPLVHLSPSALHNIL